MTSRTDLIFTNFPPRFLPAARAMFGIFGQVISVHLTEQTLEVRYAHHQHRAAAAAVFSEGRNPFANLLKIADCLIPVYASQSVETETATAASSGSEVAAETDNDRLSAMDSSFVSNDAIEPVEAHLFGDYRRGYFFSCARGDDEAASVASECFEAPEFEVLNTEFHDDALNGDDLRSPSKRGRFPKPRRCKSLWCSQCRLDKFEVDTARLNILYHRGVLRVTELFRISGKAYEQRLALQRQHVEFGLSNGRTDMPSTYTKFMKMKVKWREEDIRQCRVRIELLRNDIERVQQDTIERHVAVLEKMKEQSPCKPHTPTFTAYEVARESEASQSLLMSPIIPVSNVSQFRFD